MERGELSITRVALFQGALLSLLLLLAPLRLLEPRALVLGALLMLVNYALLGCGLKLALAPLGRRGRVRLGVALLALKLMLLLGILAASFRRFELDGASFAVGVSTLLAALVLAGASRALVRS